MNKKELAQKYDLHIQNKLHPLSMSIKEREELDDFFESVYEELFYPKTCKWIYDEIVRSFFEYHQHKCEADFIKEFGTDSFRELLVWASNPIVYRFIEEELQKLNEPIYWKLLKNAQSNIIKKIRIMICKFLEKKEEEIENI